MNRRRPRKASEVGSFAELRTYYDQAIAELDECHRQRRAIEGESKANRKDLMASRSEANKAGYWSGAAAIAVTIFYEAFKVVGSPGGRAWAEWWGHVAVYGVIVWCVTMTFGWAYRATHSGS